MNLAHHFGGGVYIKETHIPKGEILWQHSHAYEHLSYLVSGEVAVSLPDSVKVVHGPACMVIEAGKVHQVQALTDCTWLCIHSTSETDPEKVDSAIVKGD